MITRSTHRKLSAFQTESKTLKQWTTKVALMLCPVHLCRVSGNSDLYLENAHITRYRFCWTPYSSETWDTYTLILIQFLLHADFFYCFWQWSCGLFQLWYRLSFVNIGQFSFQHLQLIWVMKYFLQRRKHCLCQIHVPQHKRFKFSAQYMLATKMVPQRSVTIFVGSGVSEVVSSYWEFRKVTHKENKNF